MATIAEAGNGSARLLRLRVERAARALDSVEEAAQALCELTFEAFEPSVVLARVFGTVPLDKLPRGSRVSVMRFADRHGIADDLDDDVQVLTLLGSFGVEAAWRDRTDSVSHGGIPLVSSKFINAIPMMARLLKELRVPLAWLDGDGDESIVSDVMGRTSGVFYVRDAVTAVDGKARKIITAQDFVAKHRIKTVFGAGGGFLGSSMLLIAVVFTRDDVERSQVDYFVPVVNALKLAVAPLVMAGRVFATHSRSL